MARPPAPRRGESERILGCPDCHHCLRDKAGIAATYRIQLNRGFGFDAASRIVPYLDALGVSHLYVSPWFRARTGSTHGYDITDHNAVNPELGGGAALDHLAATLADYKMGRILDIVPNHMAVGSTENKWWYDVLEWGRASQYADYFDFDWDSPNRELKNKLLLPVLADQYGRVLEAGGLVLRFDAASGAFEVWHNRLRFPISPIDYGALISAAIERTTTIDEPGMRRLRTPLATLGQAFADLSGQSQGANARERRARGLTLKARLAELVFAHAPVATLQASTSDAITGRSGDSSSFQALHDLLERQHYRLACWQVASDEVNYRRFFNINELAGIRMEKPRLFTATHRLVAKAIAEGKVHGLRIDHIDGMFDPQAYCERLRALAVAAVDRDEPLFLWSKRFSLVMSGFEKIGPSTARPVTISSIN